MTQDVRAKIQAEALARWELAGKRGLLAMGTGSGKTKVALMAAWKAFQEHGENLRVLLAVPTEKLRDENWPEEIKKWNMYPLIEEKGMLEAVCYASMPKKPKGHYHLVILDEAHRSTEYNTQIFGDITYDSLIALSATVPNDPVKARILSELAPTVFTYSIDDGVNDGVVADYDLIVVEVPPDDVDKRIKAGSKKKPFNTTESKHYAYLSKQVDPLLVRVREVKKELMAEEFAAGATGDYTKVNALKKDLDTLDVRVKMGLLARTRFIYNMKSKEDAAKRILKRILPLGRTLIFAGSIDQAEKLSQYRYHSKCGDGDLKKLKAEEIDELAVVNALNEGHNVPNLDQALIVQVSSNERDLVQRIGRVIRYRPGHKARIFVLVSTGTVDETWAKKALEGINPGRITYISHKNF